MQSPVVCKEHSLTNFNASLQLLVFDTYLTLIVFAKRLSARLIDVKCAHLCMYV